MENSPNLPEVSPSRVNTYFDCPKKHHFIYELQLEPKVKVKKRSFDKGNYFHELAHVVYQAIKAGATPGSVYLQETIKNRIVQDMEKLESPTADLLAVFSNISKRILRYIKEQSPKIDKGIRVEDVEAELKFDTGRGFYIFGYTDVRFWQNDEFVIRDHKTGEKAWSKLDVRFHNQNLMYAVAAFFMMNVVPRVQINFINTKEYAQKEPGPMFQLDSQLLTKRELEIYFEQICALVDRMLKSDPIPHYGKHCAYCPFQTPCFMERKGIDSSEVIEAHFTERKSRHGHFTEENSTNDTTDQKNSGLPIKW